MIDQIEYTYKLNIYRDLNIPKRNIFVKELFNDKIINTWSIEEIESRWRWPWDQRKERESFMRCKKWLQENHPELML